MIYIYVCAISFSYTDIIVEDLPLMIYEAYMGMKMYEAIQV